MFKILLFSFLALFVLCHAIHSSKVKIRREMKNLALFAWMKGVESALELLSSKENELTNSQTHLNNYRANFHDGYREALNLLREQLSNFKNNKAYDF